MSIEELPSFLKFFFGVLFLSYLCIIIGGKIIDIFVVDDINFKRRGEQTQDFLSIKIPFFVGLRVSGLATILTLIFYLFSLLIVAISFYEIAETIFSKNIKLAENTQEASYLLSGLISILISLLFVYITNILKSVFYIRKSQRLPQIEKSDEEIVQEIIKKERR